MENRAVLRAAEVPALPWRRLTETRSFKELIKGLWENNPTFRMILAMCPTLGATNMAINGFTMGVSTALVTVASSTTVSLIRRLVPSEVRIPTYMIIIAAYVTIVDLFLRAFVPELSKALGPFVPLIVTNCFVLGRAEAFASQNGPWLSAMDALGVGLGFTGSLTALGIIRELLGFGSIFQVQVLGSWWQPWVIMILPGGAFLVLGLFIGIIKYFSPGGALGGA
ncbi:MAG: electron transport complex subunit RsxE [Candidatus Bipolaricaulia bacterium]